jgi:hypothetical protein
MRHVTLPGGRSVSVIETIDDPSRPWAPYPVGSHYIVQRERVGDAVAREAVTGSSTLALVLNKPEAEALAVLLNVAPRPR